MKQDRILQTRSPYKSMLISKRELRILYYALKYDMEENHAHQPVSNTQQSLLEDLKFFGEVKD